MKWLILDRHVRDFLNGKRTPSLYPLFQIPLGYLAYELYKTKS